MRPNYIVVLGSLLSGLGKGIVSSSIVRMLHNYDINIMPLKFDGYLNYDCGTMNPLKHGEVFVLEDRSEVDMDFGTYERFLNRDLNGSFSITGGKLFSEVIAKERKGEFLGSDVQIIPHLTNHIISKIEETAIANNLDTMLIEVGGTVGDIENSYFIEAIRQLALKNRVVFIQLTYVPELEVVGEQKTKPAQLASRSLMQLGIQPDFLVTRSKNALSNRSRDKLAMFTNLPAERIIDNHDCDSIYTIPKNFMDAGFDRLLLKELGYGDRKLNEDKLESWNHFVDSVTNGGRPVNIAVVGKYVDLHDSYTSVNEAIMHACASLGAKPRIKWIESEELENRERAGELLCESDGIIVPGGFGSRGIQGMINAIEYARTKGKPYLGICLGMQLMAIEFARNVANLKDADSTEFNPNTADKIIHIMEEQKTITAKGGTMRLGSWPAKVKEGTIAFDAYRRELIHERHRHRYEFNNDYRDKLESLGLRISATTPDGNLVEIIEWRNSFGIAMQAHPELKSRPENPAPIFVEFIRGSMGNVRMTAVEEASIVHEPRLQ